LFKKFEHAEITLSGYTTAAVLGVTNGVFTDGVPGSDHVADRSWGRDVIVLTADFIFLKSDEKRMLVKLPLV
jgi:hypothetical protein